VLLKTWKIARHAAKWFDFQHWVCGGGAEKYTRGRKFRFTEVAGEVSTGVQQASMLTREC
jgi:hypothetical protein